MKQTKLRNQIQLITYADSLGRDLKELKVALDTHLGKYIGGVHILPFYPSSADRGFAPLTHLEVNPVYGTWEDIQAISADYDLMVDLVANHISAQSSYYQDFLIKGQRSTVADMFLTTQKVFGSTIDPDQLGKIYRPRPTPPYQEVVLGDGTRENVWMSFSEEQIDVDWDSPITQDLMKQFLHRLGAMGTDLIRLDAVGYILKRPGTNSFLIPEVYDRIEWMAKVAKEYQIEFLPEVHFHYSKQLEIAEKCDWVYDFALPMLTLYALYFGDSYPLENWIRMRPANQITTLDTHDGIGVTDVEDLMTPDQIDQTRKIVMAHGGNEAFRATGKGAQNLDIYQINTTYYTAVGNDDAYLAARAIQFFVPGIPQIYHMGMLCGGNDIEKFMLTGVGRDLNRHDYTLEEIEQEVSRLVVQRLFALMEFRNTYPAFNGDFQLLDTPEGQIAMSWKLNQDEARLEVDLTTYLATIHYQEGGEWKSFQV